MHSPKGLRKVDIKWPWRRQCYTIGSRWSADGTRIQGFSSRHCGHAIQGFVLGSMRRGRYAVVLQSRYLGHVPGVASSVQGVPQEMLTGEHVVMADTGDCIFWTQQLKLPYGAG